MIVTYYENHQGGVNNLAVALDRETGLCATSTKGKYTAVKNLKRKLKTNASFRNGEIGQAILDGFAAGFTDTNPHHALGEYIAKRILSDLIAAEEAAE